MPEAVVEIRDSNKGTIQSEKTNREGAFQFFYLAPARYALTVSHVGFRTVSKDVTVPLGPPLTINAALEVAQEKTTVKVTGRGPA